MEPVTWSAALAGILGLLASLPKILGYIDRLVAAQEKRAQAEADKAREMRVANGIEKAKITKNTADLESAFRNP